MTLTTTGKAIARILKDLLNVPSVRATQRLVDDLNVDSLLLLQLADALEIEFGISIPVDDLEIYDNFGTVGNVVSYIEAKSG